MRFNRDVELDLTDSSRLIESVQEILLREKNYLKIKLTMSVVGAFAIIFTFFLMHCYHPEKELGAETAIAESWSTLLVITNVADVNKYKIRLLTGLKSQLNSVPDADLKIKYLDLLSKLIENQTFPKNE